MRRRTDCVPFNYNSFLQHVAECTTKPEFDVFAVSMPPIRLDRAILRKRFLHLAVNHLEYAVFLQEVVLTDVTQLLHTMSVTLLIITLIPIELTL